MRYCPYFCEENIWHLCQDAAVVEADAGGDRRVIPAEDRRVVFIGSDGAGVPMDHQRAGRGALIVWDYHVVLMAQRRDGWTVWDLDCVRGLPLPVCDWLVSSFLVDRPLEAYRQLTRTPFEAPRFRVVDVDDYLEHFSSDRSHMRDARGRQKRRFPDWPPIVDAAGTNNVMRFADTRAAFVGDVLSYDEMRLLFCSK